MTLAQIIHFSVFVLLILAIITVMGIGIYVFVRDIRRGNALTKAFAERDELLSYANYIAIYDHYNGSRIHLKLLSVSVYDHRDAILNNKTKSGDDPLLDLYGKDIAIGFRDYKKHGRKFRQAVI